MDGNARGLKTEESFSFLGKDEIRRKENAKGSTDQILVRREGTRFTKVPGKRRISGVGRASHLGRLTE